MSLITITIFVVVISISGCAYKTDNMVFKKSMQKEGIYEGFRLRFLTECNNEEKEIKVYSNYGNKKILGIDSFAFKEKENLEKVTIQLNSYSSDSYKTFRDNDIEFIIKQFAFYNCHNLNSLEIYALKRHIKINNEVVSKCNKI